MQGYHSFAKMPNHFAHMHMALPSLTLEKKEEYLQKNPQLKFNSTFRMRKEKLTGKSANVDILPWNPAIWQSRKILIEKQFGLVERVVCVFICILRGKHILFYLLFVSPTKICVVTDLLPDSIDVGQPYNHPGKYRLFTCLIWCMWLSNKGFNCKYV